MNDSEMLNEAERKRGMGYFHAEVDWLVNEQDNINKLIEAIRAKNKNAKT